jgi:hypothetical protein
MTGRVAALAPARPPDIQAALEQMRLKLREEPVGAATNKNLMGRGASAASGAPPGERERRRIMQPLSFIRPWQRRTLFSGLAAAMLVLTMVVFPSVRAAADSLLQSFRAKSVLFLPVDTERLRQLASLSSDPTALFITKPSIVGEEKSREVGSVDEAAGAVGFKPEQADVFPAKPDSTLITVHDSLKAQAQVNVDTVRDLLAAMNVNDVTLPDALGQAPITADVPAFVETTYSGAGYRFDLVQGRSPTVTLPKGVELAQLGKAGLRLIGMQPEQADELSRQIDWSSTLVVPFPANLNDVVRVQVGDAQGLMVNAGRGPERNVVIYWQRGDRFYVLAGQGSKMTNDAALLAAKSVR